MGPSDLENPQGINNHDELEIAGGWIVEPAARPLVVPHNVVLGSSCSRRPPHKLLLTWSASGSLLHRKNSMVTMSNGKHWTVSANVNTKQPTAPKFEFYSISSNCEAIEILTRLASYMVQGNLSLLGGAVERRVIY